MSELLKINVNEHTEKKGNLTYLSWAWAWAEVLKIDPSATWKVEEYDFAGRKMPCMFLPDESAMVRVTVSIKGSHRAAVLPVMDHRNKAIKGPDSMQINTAVMRCLAKAIAMHGLGLYIYAGEDLPEGEESESLVPVLHASIAQNERKRGGVMGAVLNDIHLESNVKTALAKLAFNVSELAKKSSAEALDLIDDQGLEADERLYLWSLLASNVRSALKKEGEARKETA